MGDVIPFKAVLERAADRTRPDQLHVATQNGELRTIPCRPNQRPKGLPVPTGGHEWAYHIEGNRIHVAPSLLCTDTGFHTDYHWSVEFELATPPQTAFDLFQEINPTWKQL